MRFSIERRSDHNLKFKLRLSQLLRNNMKKLGIQVLRLLISRRDNSLISLIGLGLRGKRINSMEILSYKVVAT